MDTYGSRGGERLEGYQWIILCIYVYTFRAETKAFIPVNVLRIPVLICSSAFASSPGDERLIYKYIFSKRGKPKGNRSGETHTRIKTKFFFGERDQDNRGKAGEKKSAQDTYSSGIDDSLVTDIKQQTDVLYV